MTGTETTESQSIGFNSIVYPRKSSEINVVLFVESLRERGGRLAEAPIRIFEPELGKSISDNTRNRLSSLSAEIVPFEIEPELIEFPFMGEAVACKNAENLARKNSEQLAWIAGNTVIVQEPIEFLLRPHEQLRYRPVHHLLLGSHYDEEIDDFWKLVYDICGVSDEDVFPMTTHVDRIRARPYFNAGCLVVRPDNRLLSIYQEKYQRVYLDGRFTKFYEKNQLYRIFVHQAILSGTIISRLDKSELFEMPSTYNYPMHLYKDDISDERPDKMDEVVTLRHETFYKDADWYENTPFGDWFRDWLLSKIQSMTS